jgi:hypothetical protein
MDETTSVHRTLKGRRAKIGSSGAHIRHGTPLVRHRVEALYAAERNEMV